MTAKLSRFSAMRLGAEPEEASPRIVKVNIGLIDLPMPQKLTPNGYVCCDCSERQQSVLDAALPA